MFVLSGQDDLSGEEEVEDHETQAGPSKNTERQRQEEERVGKKKRGRPSAAGKGRGNAGRAVKQAEGEELSASEPEEEEHQAEEEEEAKPSRRRRAAASPRKSPLKKKKKSGEPFWFHLYPALCSMDCSPNYSLNFRQQHKRPCCKALLCLQELNTYLDPGQCGVHAGLVSEPSGVLN